MGGASFRLNFCAKLYIPPQGISIGLWTMADAKTAKINRLNRIEGQVRGVAQMIENDRYCIDILHQIQAI